MSICKYGMGLLLILWCSLTNAQLIHPHHIEQRAAIDAKRSVADRKGREALLRSREFIREDSTYYVGYLFEGAYKATHASDYFGFQNAIAPLEKSKQLLESDYLKQLTLKTTDHFQLYYAYNIQKDYQEIANLLFDAYMNTEKYQKAYDLCRSVAAMDMVMEYYFTPYTSLTWLTNKLKIRQQKDYNFLENTVQENLELSHRYLDTALMRNDINRKYIGLVMPGVYDENIMTVNHYRALLYSYNFQIDSADKYYNILKEQTFYSHNNRGNYLMMKGLFRQATVEYINEDAMSVMYGNKHLKEYVYYQSILDIYKHDLTAAINGLQDKIATFGSTPGFGWYQIALARAYLYDGNLVNAQAAIQKAEKFKELHIGTSLGQGHYDFSLNMVKYKSAIQKIQWLKKRHSSWWWRPSVISRLIQLSWEAYSTKYLMISQLADNPEREMVIYKIMASESITTWDELMDLILELDEDYFIDYFENELENATERPVVQNYYRLILANLYLKKDDLTQAHQYMEAINEHLSDVDVEYEKLFMARYYESLARYSIANDDNAAADKWYTEMYRMYPQMAGFTTHKQAFCITLNSEFEIDDDIVDGLEKSNINWVDSASEGIPNVNIKMEMQGTTKVVQMSVTLDGQEICKDQRFYSEDKDAMNYSILRAVYGMALME